MNAFNLNVHFLLNNSFFSRCSSAVFYFDCSNSQSHTVQWIISVVMLNDRRLKRSIWNWKCKKKRWQQRERDPIEWRRMLRHQTTAKRPNQRRKNIIKKLNQDKNAKVHFGCALARDIEQHFKNHDVKHDYLYRFGVHHGFGCIYEWFLWIYFEQHSCAWIEWCVVFMNWWWIQNKTVYKSMRLCIRTMNDTALKTIGRASEGEQKINGKLVIDAYKMLMPRHSFNRLLSFYSHYTHWASRYALSVECWGSMAWFYVLCSTGNK